MQGTMKGSWIRNLEAGPVLQACSDLGLDCNSGKIWSFIAVSAFPSESEMSLDWCFSISLIGNNFLGIKIIPFDGHTYQIIGFTSF